MKLKLAFLGILLFLLTMASLAFAASAGWHCHPKGGSCVAAEAGIKVPGVPYPRSRLVHAHVYRYKLDAHERLQYSAFTTAAACEAARMDEARIGRSVVGTCRAWTAAYTLRKVGQ